MTRPAFVYGVAVATIASAIILISLAMLTKPARISDTIQITMADPITAADDLAQNSATGKLFSGDKIRRYTDTQVPFDRSGAASSDAFMTATPGQEDLMCKQWAVVTTIFEPSPSIIAAAKLSEWCMVIVADRKTDTRPYKATDDLSLAQNVVLLDVPTQERIARRSPFVRESPWNHFARKNIGYLYAISHGAQFVFDFDDDNLLKKPLTPLPTDTGWLRNVHLLAAEGTVGNVSVINPYPLMGAPGKDAWPRGFPLEQIKNNLTTGTLSRVQDVSLDSIAVIQSLANHDPDVDAVFRLTRDVPFNFSPAQAHPVALAPTSYSPYNAQATVHTRKAFWAMLLPRTVPGRVSDIWRSYFSEKLFGVLGLSVVFVPPRVVQFRNAHNYIADLESESALYFKTGRLLEFLTNQVQESALLPERLRNLWVELYERSYIEKEDVKMMELWLQALLDVGYVFPEVPSTPQSPLTRNPDQDLLAQSTAQGRTIPETPTPTSTSFPGKQSARCDIDTVPSAALIVRTYYKDKRLASLVRSVHRFVNRRLFGFYIVLDDDTAKDHAYGSEIKTWSNATVVYQGLPPGCTSMPCADFFHARAFKAVKYARAGYDRQQWDTFHLDLHTDTDMIGILDADACLNTYLTHESALSDDGRIILRAIGLDPPNYANDLKALNISTAMLCTALRSSEGHATQVDCPEGHALNFMYTDTMPMWFWRDTLPKCRSYIAQQWNSSFAEAFRQFSKDSFSQFNIMSHCALLLEPDRYKLVLSSDPVGAVFVGANMCKTQDGQIGCCRSFGQSCETEFGVDNMHVLRWLKKPLEQNKVAESYYSKVAEQVSRMRECEPRQLHQMTWACNPVSDQYYQDKLACIECKHEFIVIRNNACQLYTKDLEAARLKLNTVTSDSRNPGMIVEFVDGDLLTDPHVIFGYPQVPPRFNKWWSGWEEIGHMQTRAIQCLTDDVFDAKLP